MKIFTVKFITILLFCSSNLQGQDSSQDETWIDYSNLDQPISQDVTNGLTIESIIEPLSDYTYSAFNKGDPFLPPVKKKSITSEEVPVISQLQLYDLDTLKLAGIWKSEDDQGKALILTPDKQGVIIKKNDPIGSKGGIVAKVAPTHIIIREFTLNEGGVRQFNDIHKFLDDNKDEKPEAIVIQSDGTTSIVNKKPKEPEKTDPTATAGEQMSEKGVAAPGQNAPQDAAKTAALGQGVTQAQPNEPASDVQTTVKDALQSTGIPQLQPPSKKGTN